MNLLWTLLRKHISISQFCGFLLANLAGMTIILLCFQFYNDVMPVFTANDSFLKTDYLMVSKRIGMGTTLSGRNSTFSPTDINDLQNQSFVKRLAAFTQTAYKTDVRLSIDNQQILNTDMFFESIPDSFAEIDNNIWKWEEGQNVIPVILPRTYINMYNFGFARSHSLPQISDGLMGMIALKIIARNDDKEQIFTGRVVAFSNSLSNILVPQSFMEWSNHAFASDKENAPTRLLMEVYNPADEQINNYFEDHGLEIDSDKLNSERAAYFLRLLISIFMVVGFIICILSFFILLLSIYLLVEKNTDKLQNLLLIGYSTRTVALPYQMLTLILNVAVFITSIALVALIRPQYIAILRALYPDINSGTMLYSTALGLILFLTSGIVNYLVIRTKINKL